MGYDLHITRKEFWSDEDGATITLDEWREYVSRDPDIVADPHNPGLEHYVLITHSERWPLWWDRSGEVNAKNPDEAVIAKLVQIARALDAKVLGDDDEIYGVEESGPTLFDRR